MRASSSAFFTLVRKDTAPLCPSHGWPSIRVESARTRNTRACGRWLQAAGVAASSGRSQVDYVQHAMDDEAAVSEAHRRWGQRGAVSIADQWKQARCLVGELCQGPRFRVR